MTGIPQEKTTDKTKVSDLTVGELKAIIHEILSEKLAEMENTLFLLEQLLPDPDEGKTVAEISREMELDD